MAEILNKRRVNKRTYDEGDGKKRVVFQKGQAYFDEDTQQYELVDENWSDIPKKRTLDTRTYPVDENTFKVIHQKGANYEDTVGDIQPCETDIVVGSSENGYDYSVERTRFPVHIDADGKRRHIPDRNDPSTYFEIDRPPLPSLGSPVVNGNKIVWSRPGWYDYTVVVLPEGSKIFVDFWQQPPTNTLTFNTKRAGLNPAEADAFMERPPTAKDANGNNVPLTWVKENKKITVSMNDVGATYPIRVDPTITIQPTVDLIDTYIDTSNPDTNDGSSDDLWCCGYTYGYKRSLLAFKNLDYFVPIGSTITNTTMSLYCTWELDFNQDIDVCRLIQPAWTEMGATWNDYDGTNPWSAGGGDYTTTDKATQGGSQVDERTTWTITTLMQDAMANRGAELHLLVKYKIPASGNDRRTFGSNEAAIDERPTLIVTYTTDQEYEGATKDTFISAKSTGSNYGDDDFFYAGCYSASDEGYRPLFRWDMTGEFSGGETIDGAALLAYQYDSASAYENDPSKVYRLTQTAWVELEATYEEYSTGNAWATAGGDYTAVDASPTTYAAEEQRWMGWNVTDLIQDALDNRSQIANLIIIHTEDGSHDYGKFRSTDYATAADRPKLEIMYTSGGQIETLAGQSDGLSTAGIPAMTAIRELIGSSAGVCIVSDLPLIENTLLIGASAGGSTAGVLTIKCSLELSGASNGVGVTANIPAMTAIRKLLGASDGLSTAVITEIKCALDIGGASAGLSTASVPAMTANRKLAGASNGACIVSDIPEIKVSINIGGQSDGLSTAGGVVKVSKTFIGLSSGVGAHSPPTELKVTKKLIGDSDGLSTVTSVLNILSKLAGASDGLSTASATVDKSIALSGASNGVATVADTTVKVVKELTSSIACLSVVADVLIKTSCPFDGTSDGTSTVAATVKCSLDLVGQSNGTSIVSGIPAMQSVRKLAGASAGLSTAGASLEETTNLAGASAGGSTAEANVKITSKLIGASDGTSTAVATLEEATLLAGASDGLSNVDNVLLKVDKELGGSSAGVSTASATVTIPGEGEVLLAGATDGTSTASANTKVTTTLIGVSNGVAAVANIPALTAIRELAGVSDGTSTAIAAVGIGVDLAGTSTGASTVTGLAKVTKTLVAASDGLSTVAATVLPIVELIGQSGGTSTVTALAKVTKKLSGASFALSTVNGAISPIRGLIGATDGSSTVSALIKRLRELAGLSAGTTTVQATVKKLKLLSGTTSGTSTASVAVELEMDIILGGSSAGIAAVSCSIIDVPYHQRGSVELDTDVKGRGSIRSIKRLQ